MTQAGDASAMNAGSQGSQQGAGVMDQAKDSVQQFAGQAKEQATQRVQGVFEQGKSRAAEQLTGVAQTLRQTTQQLQSGGQLAFAAPYLERGVSQLERLAEYVRTADAQDVAQQVESFGRRQPALFLGILFGTGLAGARFLKSSQRNATAQGASQGGSRYPNYGSYGSYAGSQGASAGAAGGYAGGYGAGSYGDASGSSASASSSLGTSGGSTTATGGSGLSGSVGGFYDDSRTGGTSGSGMSGGSGSGLGSSADDERGMDIGPTSSGLRGDI